MSRQSEPPKVSDITVQDLESFLRLGPGDEDEGKFLQQMLAAAVSYLTEATGLKKERLDDYPEFVYAVMVLVSHMYDNRSYYVGADYGNHLVQTIINMHRVNYV